MGKVDYDPAGNYMFKVNNRNTRTKCEICSKLTIKTPERGQWRRSSDFIVNFEHVSRFALVSLLLTLTRWIDPPPEKTSLKKSSLIRVKGASKMVFFYFCLFHFSKFQISNLLDFESSYKEWELLGSYKILLRYKYIWSKSFWQWNDGHFEFFWNLHGNAFCFFIFSKWKKYCNLTFNDTFEI